MQASVWLTCGPDLIGEFSRQADDAILAPMHLSALLTYNTTT